MGETKVGKKIPPETINLALNLMTIDNIGQHEISRQTGLSRPYIKKLADNIGYKFPRNGFEILGRLCMCTECGELFRRPPSKVETRQNLFCSEFCSNNWRRGANHKDWKGGKTVNTFSSWVKNQASYKRWREEALELAGYRCYISGRTDNLEVHHILPKSTFNELSLNPENGCVLNKDIHIEIHKLIRDGKGFEESIQLLKIKYQNKEK